MGMGRDMGSRGRGSCFTDVERFFYRDKLSGD
jgi:hypothetical protein